MWDLTIPPFDPVLQAEKVLSVWDYSFLGGRLYVLMWNWPIFYLSSLAQNIMRVEVFYTLLHWFLFLLSGIGMYWYVLKTALLKNDKHLRWAALAGALMYTFNPFWIFRLNVTFYTIYILAFLPYLLLSLHRAIDGFTMTKSWFFGWILSAVVFLILMSPGLANLPVAMATAIFVGLYILGYSVLHNRTRSLVVILAILTPIVLLTQLWWLYPNVFHSSVKESISRDGQYLTDSYIGLQDWASYEYSSFYNFFRNNSYPNPKIDDEEPWGMPLLDSEAGNQYYSDAFVIIGFLIPILGFSVLLSRRLWKKTTVLVLGAIMLVLTPIFIGLRPPFGEVVGFLFLKVPLLVLRRPPSYMFIVSFVYAYLFAIFVYDALNRLSEVKSKFKKNIGLWLVMLCALLTIGVYSFPRWVGIKTSINLFTNQLHRKKLSSEVVLPTYAKEVVEYLNRKTSLGGVLVLPKAGMLRSYNWDSGYFGWDYYYLTLKRPVLSTATSRYEIYYAYSYVHQLLSTEASILDGDVFARFLAKLKIEYVLVAEDSLLHTGTAFYRNDEITAFLEEQQGINHATTFGPIRLYKNELCDELCKDFYVASEIDLINTKEDKDEEMKDFYQKYLHRIQQEENAVFVYQNEGWLVNDGIVTATITSVKKNDPAHYELSVIHEETGPVLLSSTISYDEGWEATIDGQALKHIKVNGMFNGWVINSVEDAEVLVSVRFITQEKADRVRMVSWTSIAIVFLSWIGLVIRKNYKKT